MFNFIDYIILYFITRFYIYGFNLFVLDKAKTVELYETLKEGKRIKKFSNLLPCLIVSNEK